VFRWGYCDVESFKRLGAIFAVIRCVTPDSFGGGCLGSLVGGTLVVKRFQS
jgi:hypothetical protein